MISIELAEVLNCALETVLIIIGQGSIWGAEQHAREAFIVKVADEFLRRTVKLTISIDFHRDCT
jgi:hypothetical protein